MTRLLIAIILSTLMCGCLSHTSSRTLATISGNSLARNEIDIKIPKSSIAWWLALHGLQVGASNSQKTAVILMNTGSRPVTIFFPNQPGFVIEPGEKRLVWEGAVVGSFPMFACETKDSPAFFRAEFQFVPPLKTTTEVRFIATKTDAL